MVRISLGLSLDLAHTHFACWLTHTIRSFFLLFCVTACVFTCNHTFMIALVDNNNIWISDKMFIRVVNHQMVG